MPDDLYIELSGASGSLTARNWAVILGHQQIHKSVES
jgi:hypothetical protein